MKKNHNSAPSKRHLARCLLVQALYQWHMTQDTPSQIIMQFGEKENFLKSDSAYFQQVLPVLIKKSEELDALFKPFLDRAIEELNPVEWAILRLGSYELVDHPEIPYRVVLNEAIELAKEYGATEAHKYINGVLDQLAKKVRGKE